MTKEDLWTRYTGYCVCVQFRSRAETISLAGELKALGFSINAIKVGILKTKIQ